MLMITFDFEFGVPGVVGSGRGTILGGIGISPPTMHVAFPLMMEGLKFVNEV